MSKKDFDYKPNTKLVYCIVQFVKCYKEFYKINKEENK